MSEDSSYQQLLTFTEGQVRELNDILATFTSKSGAKIAMLARLNGQVVSYVGPCSEKDSFVIGALASAGFIASSAACNELEKSNTQSLKHYLLEGNDTSIYISSIDQKLLWICTFSEPITIGALRIQSERACKSIKALLKREIKKQLPSTQPKLDESFGKELELEIIKLFSTFGDTH